MVPKCYDTTAWFNVNRICDENAADQDIRMNFGTSALPADNAACFAWTGYDKGQGAPTALHEDGEGCPTVTHCESERCDGWGLTEGLCRARLAGGEGCNEDSDCLSNSCTGVINWTCD